MEIAAEEAAALELSPLLLLVLASKLLVVASSVTWGALLQNAFLGLCTEATFGLLCIGLATRATPAKNMPRACVWGLRTVVLPLLQVLAIADMIYTGLIGSPLRMRLVAFFVGNLFSDYVQSILTIYVGVPVPLLVAMLMVSLTTFNWALVQGYLRASARGAAKSQRKPSRGESDRSGAVGTTAVTSSTAAIALAVASLLVLTAYAERLPRHGGSIYGHRYSACGNVFTRGLVEMEQLAMDKLFGGPADGLAGAWEGVGGQVEPWAELATKWTAASINRKAQRQGVVLVGLETARADAFGPWRHTAQPANSGAEVFGGEAAVSHATPFIDSLARRGRIVSEAYTPVPNTVKAIIALFCGLSPAVTMAWVEFESLDLSECLPALLKRAGWATGVFTSGALRDHVIRPNDIRKMGFEHTVGYEQLLQDSDAAGRFEMVNHLGLEDDAVVGAAVEWAAQQSSLGKPFFMGVFTIVTHAPYDTPMSFLNSSTSDTSQAKYLATVRYTDRFLQKLYNGLEEAGLVDKTLFIAAGDHGEMFGEHGQYQHGASLMQPALRIPIVLAGPEIGPAGSPIEGLRSLLDIVPTVLHWLSAEVSGGAPLRAGKSLLPPPPPPAPLFGLTEQGGDGDAAKDNEPAEASEEGHDELPFFSFFDSDHIALRFNHHNAEASRSSVRPLKLVADLRTGAIELFDLRADPREEHDVAKSPSIMSRGALVHKLARLRAWRERTNHIFALGKERLETERQQEPQLLYTVSGAVLAAANGVYQVAPDHGGFKGSPFACDPCFSQVGDHRFVLVRCDLAGRTTSTGVGTHGDQPLSQTWSLVLRFTSFDAVLYSATSMETMGLDLAISAPRPSAECEGLPEGGWELVAVACFRFGDLDQQSIDTFVAMEKGWMDSDTANHLASVVVKGVAEELRLPESDVVVEGFKFYPATRSPKRSTLALKLSIAALSHGDGTLHVVR